MLKDDALLERLDQGWKAAGLDSRRAALLAYVEKLTLCPGEMKRQDLDPLRDAEFSDEDILAIAEVTAYYAYVNRIADGLGVELEPWVGAEDESD